MISGKTKLYALVAHPVSHVRTPQAINALFETRGLDAVMVPCEVAPDALARFVDGLRSIANLGGLVVTVPHKIAVASLCDELTPRAQAAGAVNTIRRDPDGTLTGDLLDGVGFVAGLKQAGIALEGRSVYLAGAGGAANAIALALAEQGIARLTIANRTRARAEDLLHRLAAHRPGLRVEIGTRDPSGHDIVVNGTSLGLRPDDALPLDCDRLTSSMTVAEVIMQPRETPLLSAAAAAGCRIQYGQPMLDCQLALMADFLTATR